MVTSELCKSMKNITCLSTKLKRKIYQYGKKQGLRFLSIYSSKMFGNTFTIRQKVIRMVSSPMYKISFGGHDRYASPKNRRRNIVFSIKGMSNPKYIKGIEKITKVR